MKTSLYLILNAVNYWCILEYKTIPFFNDQSTPLIYFAFRKYTFLWNQINAYKLKNFNIEKIPIEIAGSNNSGFYKNFSGLNG